MFLSKGGVWDAFAVCGVCFPGKQRSADIFISVYHTIYNCGSKKLRIVLFCDTGNEVGNMELFWTQITDAQPALPARSKAHGSAWGVSLLAYAVRAVWGIALPETAELPGGKPYFPACPQVHFSVSHTRTAALVAVSAAPVGADVEQVRPLLDHLGALAKELDMAVLLISHMSKPGPGVCSALDRLLGSSDFRNAARSILIAGRDPEHPEVRVVAHAKNSLGQPGESQRYRICPQGTVAYDGPCTLTADAIIREAGTPATGNGRPSAALANAIEALEKQLSFVGWVEAGEVYRLCAERDISVSTIRRARVALGLKTLYIGNQPNRKNYWYQPELEEASVVADITNQNQQIQLA